MRRDDLGSDLAFETLAVHAGAEPDAETGAVAPPIYQTSTYAQDGVNRPRGGYDYARTANPTRDRLQRAVAALEGGGEGIAFASGSAATAAIAELAAPGSEIVVGDDVYGGTFRYLEQVRRQNGVDAHYANLADDPDAHVGGPDREDATRVVRDPDESAPEAGRHRRHAARTIADRYGARPDRPLLVVDNTFASPALQRPLDFGADIVFHSATKYLAGHSDTVLGIAVTRDPAIGERLRFLQNAMGGVPGPFDCFLVLRGLRTLHLRVERHAQNAAAVAAFLAGRSDVAWVAYPGLAAGQHAHPQAALAATQMRGGGGMISFRPSSGGVHERSSTERAAAVAESTRIFTLAESLGGVESLIEVPARMTHMSVAGSALEVPDDLVRLSVGIEAAADLIEDLRRALDGS